MKGVSSDAKGQDLEDTNCSVVGIIGKTESEDALEGLECGGFWKRVKS